MTSTPPVAPVLFDPYDYAFHEDPYPTYERLRNEAGANESRTGSPAC